MLFDPTRDAALRRLAVFVPHAGRAYADSRNHDFGARNGAMRTNVSQLSPWLHAGQIAEAEVIEAALVRHNPKAAEKFIAEVLWRIYFKGYLEQRPGIWRAYCKGRDAALTAMMNNPGLRTAYSRAVEGRTGIEAFDHWARELIDTGYLHNHARMWFASIWIFTLKLDWELGADFFLRHLIDGDAASNTLSWRWVGGLHTKGKTYLARPDNIARYTAMHPDGPLAAEGLSDHAPALEEEEDHPREQLVLPDTISTKTLREPYALILHDEAASHVPLALPCPAALVIGVARPDARSPGATGTIARDFAQSAVRSGMDAATAEFGCEAHDWNADTRLTTILTQSGIERVVLPYLPVGWTRDALWPELSTLIAGHRVTVLLDSLSRATWPHAKAGFFGVKKQIDRILRDQGMDGSRQTELKFD